MKSLKNSVNGQLPPELDAMVKAVAFVTTLGLFAFGLWFFFSPPSGAWEARSRLDSSKYPDPADRIEGLNMIKKMTLEGNKMSGYQNVQEKGCRDPEPKVRVAALQTLAEITEKQPDFIKGSWGAVYVDTRFLSDLGKTDPSAKVRTAAAEYWARADVLSENGIEALKTMLDGEQDANVVSSIRECLSQRLERSYSRSIVTKETANELREQYQLRELSLK